MVGLRRSCPAGSCLVCWRGRGRGRGKLVIPAWGRNVSLWRRGGGATLAGNLLGTPVVPAGSGEGDVEHLLCAHHGGARLFCHRFHLLTRVTISTTALPVQPRAERAVAGELTHSDSALLGTRGRWVNLSLRRPGEPLGERGHPLSALCPL